MFGLSLVKSKKLAFIYENAIKIANENQALAMKLEDIKEQADRALKKHEYIKASNRTQRRKSEECERILISLIDVLDSI